MTITARDRVLEAHTVLALLKYRLFLTNETYLLGPNSPENAMCTLWCSFSCF